MMTSIDGYLKSCSPKNDVYTYSFPKEEVEYINDSLQRRDLVKEIRKLMKEGKDMGSYNLGENLRKLLKENNKTYEDFAFDLNTAPGTICKYINGKIYPPIDKVMDMAKLLNVSLDELVCGEM